VQIEHAVVDFTIHGFGHGIMQSVVSSEQGTIEAGGSVLVAVSLAAGGSYVRGISDRRWWRRTFESRLQSRQLCFECLAHRQDSQEV
jgi:hypothetical protein